jgi:hypothetical protein
MCGRSGTGTTVDTRAASSIASPSRGLPGGGPAAQAARDAGAAPRRQGVARRLPGRVVARPREAEPRAVDALPLQPAVGSRLRSWGASAPISRGRGGRRDRSQVAFPRAVGHGPSCAARVAYKPSQGGREAVASLAHGEAARAGDGRGDPSPARHPRRDARLGPALGREKATNATRSVRLLAPLRQDLAEWRLACGRPGEDAFLFPRGDGDPWRDDDDRNWRKRTFRPAALAAGLKQPRPYDLRHQPSRRWHSNPRPPFYEAGSSIGSSPSESPAHRQLL